MEELEVGQHITRIERGAPEVGEDGGWAGPAQSAHSSQEKPLKDVNQGTKSGRMCVYVKDNSSPGDNVDESYHSRTSCLSTYKKHLLSSFLYRCALRDELDPETAHK